ncbi:unnamed protein product [Rhizophagus irregularis]|nr:unnamed protein product [Rhizophagus irregularis]
MQLKTSDKLVEWIPYNQFDNIKTIDNSQNITYEFLKEIKGYSINDDDNIKKQFEEAEKFKEENALITTHLQATYTSQLLNPFTEDFSITEWL